MDARLHVSAILGLEIGDAHIIRNAGGVVTDDAIRSLVISQRLLGTKEIILIHHSDCGMVTFTDDAVKAQIKEDTGIRPPFALEAFPDVADDVRQSIARIKASPFIPHRESVRGFVYDVTTGRLGEIERRPRADRRVVRSRRRGCSITSPNQSHAASAWHLRWAGLHLVGPRPYAVMPSDSCSAVRTTRSECLPEYVTQLSHALVTSNELAPQSQPGRSHRAREPPPKSCAQACALLHKQSARLSTLCTGLRVSNASCSRVQQ